MEVCSALQPAQALFAAVQAARQQQAVPAVHANPQGARGALLGHVAHPEVAFLRFGCRAVAAAGIYVVLRFLRGKRRRGANSVPQMEVIGEVDW